MYHLVVLAHSLRNTGSFYLKSNSAFTWVYFKATRHEVPQGTIVGLLMIKNVTAKSAVQRLFWSVSRLRFLKGKSSIALRPKPVKLAPVSYFPSSLAFILPQHVLTQALSNGGVSSVQLRFVNFAMTKLDCDKPLTRIQVSIKKCSFSFSLDLCQNSKNDL